MKEDGEEEDKGTECGEEKEEKVRERRGDKRTVEKGEES